MKSSLLPDAQLFWMSCAIPFNLRGLQKTPQQTAKQQGAVLCYIQAFLCNPLKPFFRILPAPHHSDIFLYNYLFICSVNILSLKGLHKKA